MSTHQFAVYRKKKESDPIYGRADSLSAKEEPDHVTVEDYIEIYSHACTDSDSALQIRKNLDKRLPDSIGTLQEGDVIVLNHAGIVTSYYVELDRLRVLPEFIRLHPKNAAIDMDTSDFKIPGMGDELWSACDSIIIDGEQFFLMENCRFRKDAAMPVLDAYGRLVVAQSFHGFSPDVIDQIRQNRDQTVNSGKNAQKKMGREGEKNFLEGAKNPLISRYVKYQNAISRAENKNSGDLAFGHSVQKSKSKHRRLNPGMKKAEGVGKREPSQRTSVLFRLRQKQAILAGKHSDSF